MKPLGELIGASAVIEQVRDRIGRLLERQHESRRLPPVLIEGETGTGKGLLARMIHRAGPRADGPFVDVNCAAIPETLLEAEMFGYERGAFTDARRAKPGLFQTAHRGTIFLDEVGLLPEALQSKLLKVLEERSVRRLGSTRDEPVDVWVLTATNEDLRRAIRERRFREDLYHRLAVLTLSLPPLRERGEDVVQLADHFLTRACADYGVAPKGLAADARAALLAYPWPGNVRELANLMERIALLAPELEVGAATLGLPVVPSAARAPAAPLAAEPEAASSLEDAVRERVAEALRQTGWNISRTAARLGISRNTLKARIAKYGLRQGAPAPAPVAPAPRAEGRPAPPPAPAAAPPLPRAAPPLRWERRRVTLLRAALAVAPSADPPLETSRALEVMIDKVRSFGGRVEGMSPGGVVAAFGLEPMEDASSRAALAALAIQRALEHARREDEMAPAATLGIHAGEFLVGLGGGTLELSEESRREALTALDALVERREPGAVLVSAATEPFLVRRFELRQVGTPRGQAFAIAGPERVGLAIGGRLTGFVGRRHELDLLLGRLESAVRGQGQVVGISGEPGIGKSRLLHEFRGTLAGRPLAIVAGRCRAWGPGVPYLPVLDLVRQICGITEADSAAQVAEKIRTALLEAGLDLLESLRQVIHLVGLEREAEWLDALEPEPTKERIFATLQRLVLGQCRTGPLVVLVEDLQWIDTTSEEFLTALAGLVAGVPILLVSTYRPGYRPPWIDRSYATQVALQPLRPAEGAHVVRAVLGADAAPDALVGLIVDKAEGNPFFLEELARNIKEQEGGAPLVTLPDTIQEVLLGRIDRLPSEDQRLLQLAAVVGKDVDLSVVRGVSELPDAELRRGFGRLQGAEFLYETRSGPEPRYTFKHALTHDVAYASLLEGQRRALHARSLDAIERLHPDRLAEHVEALAHHAVEGGVLAKAHGYLRQAGLKAFTRCAHREAAAYFERALAALAALPEDRARAAEAVDLHFELRIALQPLGELDRTVSALRRAEALARELGDQTRLGRALAFLTDYFRLTGDQTQAVEYGRQALAIAEVVDDLLLKLRTKTYVGQTRYGLGDYRGAVPLLRWNVAALEGERKHQALGFAQLPSVHSRTCLVWCLAELGEFADGIRLGEEAVGIAEAVDHPFTLATACAGLGAVHLRRGDLEAAIPVLERGLELCRTFGLSLWLPPFASRLGLGLALAGRAPEAVPLIERAVAQSDAMRLVAGHSLVLCCLGEAYLRAGRAGDARDVARRALTLARSQGERGHEAWVLRLLGEIALATDSGADGAREPLAEALALAVELGMRPLAALCRLGLGTQAQRAGDRVAARAALQAAAAELSELGMPRWLASTAAALSELG